MGACTGAAQEHKRQAEAAKGNYPGNEDTARGYDNVPIKTV